MPYAEAGKSFEKKHCTGVTFVQKFQIFKFNAHTDINKKLLLFLLLSATALNIIIKCATNNL